MDARDKDKAIAKMLGRSLRHDLSGPAADCPETDVLAAYYDHSLSDSESAHWEAHFARCERCQHILAMLAVSDMRASAVQAHGARTSRPAWTHLLDWRWIAPAGAVAAALVLWITLRPTPLGLPSREIQPSRQEARNIPPPAPAETDIVSRPTIPARKESTAAKKKAARALPLPAPETSPVAQEKSRAAPQPAAASLEQLESRANVSERKARPAAGAARRDEQLPDAVGGPPQAAVAGAGAPPAATPLERKEFKGKEGLKESAGTQREATAVGGAAAPKRIADRMAPGGAPQSAGFVISSPQQTVKWRVGAAGKIEHSSDAGRTWQAQNSGVDTDLLAGSAPSERVCWVVGRAGTILRTIDGERWEKVASPAPTDWVSVTARDARHAAVMAADHYRYATEDGGRTWRSTSRE